MKTSLVYLETRDNLILPGLLFEPETTSKKAVIMIHGNGSSSILRYREKITLFAETLTAKGIGYLPFNNRGAGYINKVDLVKADQDKTSALYGMAYELIRETIADIDSAISSLQQRGYTDISLLGFSTGANKICLYNYLKPDNTIQRYILACGGDDSGSYYFRWGAEKFQYYLQLCQYQITHQHGRDLIIELVSEGLIVSYQSLFDTINPDGDYNIFPYYEVLNQKRLGHKNLFQEFTSIKKSTLVIYGDQDEYCYGRIPEIIDILKSKCSAPDKFTYQVIPGADHGFQGKEPELVKQITKFIAAN